MSDDMVQRLRNSAGMDVFKPDVGGTTMLDVARMTMLEAADRIEALEAAVQDNKRDKQEVFAACEERIKQLEAALRKLLELEEVQFPGNRYALRAKLVKDIASRALEGVAVHTEEIGKTLGEHMRDLRALESK